MRLSLENSPVAECPAKLNLLGAKTAAAFSVSNVQNE